jgi:hypothetical protein
MARFEAADSGATTRSVERLLSSRMVARVSALVLLVGLVTAACGSSSPSGSGTTTQSTPTTTATTSAPSGSTGTTTPTTTPTLPTLPLPSASDLSVEARIPLGLPWLSPPPQPAAAEAPNGAVFVATGSIVYVVEGNSAPVVAEHAGGQVLALAADSTDLFVETGLVVTDYSRSTGNEVTKWTLPGSGTPTSAGLLVGGPVLWAWTDFATDQSGFEYADLDRIVGQSVVAVDNHAYPGDLEMAADADGLYYEGLVNNANAGHLEFVTPSGTKTVSPDGIQFGSPIALVGGTLVAEQPENEPGDDWSTWDPTTLKVLSQVTTGIIYADPIAETGSGLLLMEVPSGSSVAGAAIAEQSPTSGEQLDSGVGFPSAAQWLLQGYYPAILTAEGGQLYLERLT